jgi:hypothetical protein
VSEPKLLASINSLYVDEPLAGTGTGLQPETLHALVESSAERELGLKVVKAANGKAGRSAGVPKGVDGGLKTELLAFTERRGSAAGGEPATVGFRMYITRSSDGAEVWEATYHRSDEPLTDNLFKLGDRLGQGGNGLRPARDLLEEGVVAALRDFGYRREAQFLNR